MQKIKRFFSSLLVFFLAFGIFSPLGVSFTWQDIYDYSEYSHKINTDNDSVLEWKISFDSPRTTFFLAFDGMIAPRAEDVEVIWKIGAVEHSQFLDIEWWDDMNRVTTFPYVVTPQSHIEYRIVYHTDARPTSLELISAYHATVGRELVFRPFLESTEAASGPHIISRAEWWADETIRYVSEQTRAEQKAAWIERGQTPRIIYESSAERAERLQTDKEYATIQSLDPASSEVVSLKRYEWSRKLVWPIKKVKEVDRIVIHHTAENLDKVADDKTLLRAIYYYHTRTKWWGDIGYNYIVWQRGDIYEWRAWGDYVEWAHVYGNNVWTVGISVMGNYEVLHLNKDQKAWLLEAIEYVARKYGINVDETDYGASLCKSGASCTWYAVSTSRLIGHRDLAATSCPWRNIYDSLSEFRNTIVWKVWKLSPIQNLAQKSIDTVDPESAIEYQLRDPATSIPTTVTPTQIPGRITSSGGKPIKILLSYSGSTLTFESAGKRASRLMLDGKPLSYTPSDDISVSTLSWNTLEVTTAKMKYTGKTLSFSTDVFRILSWSRVPAWDSVWRYNDNIFRSRLILRNEWWKLLVVNELPIEDYLKWLGEVSNGDSIEKIKTIVVAARSYAYFYQNPKNRKYQTPLYDGSDDPDSFQKYLGYGYELRSPNAVTAVKATKWKVISYKWDLVKAWYFSSSDGKTRSYKEYCETNNPGKICENIPYLQSVDDPAWVGKTRSGHGVGISGIGATYGASLGRKYDEIISYYMSGVSIVNVNQLK